MHSQQPPIDPLQSFRFCPQCGGRGLEVRHRRALCCPACGFRYFINCATTVGAFIFYGDKIILAVRGEEPHKGKLGFPGGFVEFNEAADQALHREIGEELGIQVRDMAYLTAAPEDYVYANVLYKLSSIVYTCRVDDISRIRVHDDVTGYRLVDPRSLDRAELAFPSIAFALDKLLLQLEQAG